MTQNEALRNEIETNERRQKLFEDVANDLIETIRKNVESDYSDGFQNGVNSILKFYSKIFERGEFDVI